MSERVRRRLQAAPKAKAVSVAQQGTGSVAANSEVSITCTLDPPMPVSTYTVVAQVVENAVGESLRVRRIQSKSTTEVVVNVVNNHALSARSGVVHVVAIAPD